MEKKDAYIALGSNMGNRAGNLSMALELMERNPHIEVKKVSSSYLT